MTLVSQQGGQRCPRSQLVTLGIPGVWGGAPLLWFFFVQPHESQQSRCCAVHLSLGVGVVLRGTRRRETGPLKGKHFLSLLWMGFELNMRWHHRRSSPCVYALRLPVERCHRGDKRGRQHGLGALQAFAVQFHYLLWNGFSDNWLHVKINRFEITHSEVNQKDFQSSFSLPFSINGERCDLAPTTSVVPFLGPSDGDMGLPGGV